jgi:hypothetical protein
LLHYPQSSQPVPGAVEVDQTHFANRYDLAIHIAEALKGCDFQRLSFELGVWGWLSLFHFDLLCPQDLTGARKIGAMERYLFNSESRRSSSHLIREAVIAVRTHKQHAKVLLVSPRGGIKDNLVLSELSSRQDLISNRNVIELVSQIYFDNKKGVIRHGATSRHRAGTVQRFAVVLQQLSLNFDLPAMSSRQIAGLLPEEFNHWKKRAKFAADSV